MEIKFRDIREDGGLDTIDIDTSGSDDTEEAGFESTSEPMNFNSTGSNEFGDFENAI